MNDERKNAKTSNAVDDQGILGNKSYRKPYLIGKTERKNEWLKNAIKKKQERKKGRKRYRDELEAYVI